MFIALKCWGEFDFDLWHVRDHLRMCISTISRKVEEKNQPTTNVIDL